MLRGFAGGDVRAARFAEELALDAGLTALRSRVVAHVASFKDGWIYRRHLAKWARCSVRTVQRALTQAKLEGILGIARAKPNDVPPGRTETLPCGWSHRWFVARDKVGEAVKAAIAKAKLAALMRREMRAQLQRSQPRMFVSHAEETKQLKERAQIREALAEFEAKARAGPPDHK